MAQTPVLTGGTRDQAPYFLQSWLIQEYYVQLQILRIGSELLIAKYVCYMQVI